MSRTRTLIALALAAGGLAVLLAGCVTAGPVGNRSVPEPAKRVDLDRYLGRWYELARYDSSFERGCEGVTADYARNPDGGIAVLNVCRQGAPDGRVRRARGKAKVVDPVTGAKLKVSFFGPFYGDYWVLDHADDYAWSIVGEPSGRYLWILSRRPVVEAEAFERLKARVISLGYDWSLVRLTRQPPA